MKKLASFIIVLFYVLNLHSQTTEKKNYYDYWETKIKTVWHEKGDGNKHGVEKGYYENGELKYTHDWVNGVWTTLKYYFQDGQIRIEATKSTDNKFIGEQKFYLFEKGERYLKVKAVVDNDNVTEYYFYEHPNKLGWSITKNGSILNYKKFDKSGNAIVDISFADGKFSGLISQTDYDTYKLQIENNAIKQFESNGRVTKEVSEGLILSDYEQKGLNWTLYRKLSNKHVYEIQDELIVDLYNAQLAYDVKVKELKYQREFVWYPDPTTSSVKINVNSLTNSIFAQYADDSVKTARNPQGKIIQEIKYDKGKLIWTKDFWDNGNVKTQKFGEYKLSYPGNYNTQRILEYNENGILIKESELDNYTIYNTNGEVIESKEMSDTISAIRKRLYNEYYKIESMIKSTDDYMSETFCLSNETGSFSKVCYDKTNQNVFNAISVLYSDYLNKRKVSISEATSKGYFSLSDNQKYNSIEKQAEKIKYLNDWESYYYELKPFLLEFDKDIEPFIDILNDTKKTKTLNKSLKKINDPLEIKKIIGL